MWCYTRAACAIVGPALATALPDQLTQAALVYWPELRALKGASRT